MHYKTVLAILAFSTTALAAAAKPPTYETSSTASPVETSCTPETFTKTKTKTKKTTVTITPPCPACPTTTKCTKPTVTSVDQVNTTMTSTTTVSSVTTATPGPVVELTAYDERFCGVDPVASNGNTPNFQDIHLTYNAATGASNCAKINQNPLSFSWDIIAFADVPSSCHLYFYFGDSCFDDNGGSTQFSLNNGQNACHNLRNVKSVRLFC